MQGYCHNCAAVLRTESVFCPYCGYDSSKYFPAPHQLLPETVLNGRYRVGRALGNGGFGITYVGVDTVLDLKVAIKEFYMTGFVTRDSLRSSELQITTGAYGEDFIRNRDRFLGEAKVLARFASEPGIVTVRDFFTANNTAYIVMEYLDGETLADYLKRTGSLSWPETFALLRPVLNCLSRVHRYDIIHRDISPDNIMLTRNGQVKLLDFGAAREYAGGAEHSLSVILKHGYAPVEQNSRNRGIQGPWTDVYALCATIYRCLTGKVPEDAMERVNEDDVKPPYELGRCSRPVSDVLMKGLALRRRDRWQIVDELLAALEQADRAAYGQPFFASDAPAAEEEATTFVSSASKQSVPPKAEPQPVSAPKQSVPPKAAPKQSVPPKSAPVREAARPSEPPKLHTAPKQESAPKVNTAPRQNSAASGAIPADLFAEYFGNSQKASNFSKAPTAANATAPKSAASGSATPQTLTPPVKHRGWKIFGLVMLAFYELVGMRIGLNEMDFVDYWLHNSFPGLDRVPFMAPTLAAAAYPFCLLLAMIASVLLYLCLTTVARKPGKPLRRPLAPRKKRLTVYSSIVFGLSALMLVLVSISGEFTLLVSYYSMLLAPVVLFVLLYCSVEKPPMKQRRSMCMLVLLLTALICTRLLIYGRSMIYILYYIVSMLILLVTLLSMREQPQVSKAQETRVYLCKACGRKLRVPAGKGRILVKCPCGKQHEVVT